MSVAKQLKFRGGVHAVARTLGDAERATTGVVRQKVSSGAQVEQGPARLRFKNEREALSFLQRAAIAQGGVAAWRKELLPLLSAAVVSRMSDAEVAEHFARRLAAGHVHVHRLPSKARTFFLRAPDKLEDALGPEPEPQSEDPNLVTATIGGDYEPLAVEAQLGGVAEPEELQAYIGDTPDVGEPEFDAPEQVATLVEAASRGVPYCEECAKARLALAAPPEADEDDAEELDAGAQAAALQGAAQIGAPFCEECEKARLALAAPPPDEEQDEDEEAELAQVDAGAQAAALQSAAESGAPFCEECEKARMAALAAQAQGPAQSAGDDEEQDEEEAADVDPAAQAAVMQEAANDGAPFCEECERARAAAAGSTTGQG